jgi:hypothetical protein
MAHTRNHHKSTVRDLKGRRLMQREAERLRTSRDARPLNPYWPVLSKPPRGRFITQFSGPEAFLRRWVGVLTPL